MDLLSLYAIWPFAPYILISVLIGSLLPYKKLKRFVIGFVFIWILSLIALIPLQKSLGILCSTIAGGGAPSCGTSYIEAIVNFANNPIGTITKALILSVFGYIFFLIASFFRHKIYQELKI